MLQVRADLPAGFTSDSGAINISAGSTATVDVTATVDSTPVTLVVSPASLAFAADGSGLSQGGTLSQAVSASGTGCGALGFSATQSSSPWLGISQKSDVLQNGKITGATFVVAADPSKLDPGLEADTGYITVQATTLDSSSSGTLPAQTIPVTLNVVRQTILYDSGGSLNSSLISDVIGGEFDFGTVTSTTKPIAKSLALTASARVGSAKATVDYGSPSENWLDVSPVGGTLDAQSPVGVTVTATPSALTSGCHFASVTFTASGSNPLLVPVRICIDDNQPLKWSYVIDHLASFAGTFTAAVEPGGSQSKPLGVYVQGSPSSQQVRAALAAGMKYMVTNVVVAEAQDCSWASVTPRGQSIDDLAKMAHLTLTFDASCLAAREDPYKGMLTTNVSILNADGSVKEQLPSISQPLNLLVREVASCRRTRAVMTGFVQGQAGQIAVSAGDLNLSADVQDNCGTTLNAKVAVTSADNRVNTTLECGLGGCAPQKASVGTGTYLTLTFKATPEDKELTGSSLLYPVYVGNQAANNLPILKSLENAASGKPAELVSGSQEAVRNSPLVGGAYITLRGTKLAAAAQGATAFPLPTTLGGTEVWIGNRSIPLSYVSPEQINGVVPFSVTDYSQVAVKVPDQADTARKRTSLLQAVAAYAADGNTPVVIYGGVGTQKTDPALFSDPNNPGFAIVSTSCGDDKKVHLLFYANALGPVQEPPADGEPAGNDQDNNRTLEDVTVQIGGKEANVEYAGLRPATVSVYQIRVAMPEDLTEGEWPVTVMAGGRTSPELKLKVQNSSLSCN